MGTKKMRFLVIARGTSLVLVSIMVKFTRLELSSRKKDARLACVVLLGGNALCTVT